MNTFKVISLITLSIFWGSCSKDDDTANDPIDTVTLNMLNEQNGKTLLGESNVYINKANNFFTPIDFISDTGKASGVGVKMEPQMKNLTQEVAVTPGNMYQIFCYNSIRNFPSGNYAAQIKDSYYQVYVVSPIVSNNLTTGAIVKYATASPNGKELSQINPYIGTLKHIGETIEYTLPQGTECDFRDLYPGLESFFQSSITGNEIRISLLKEPDRKNGPYGEYQVHIRLGNIFTTVLIKVGM